MEGNNHVSDVSAFKVYSSTSFSHSHDYEFFHRLNLVEQLHDLKVIIGEIWKHELRSVSENYSERFTMFLLKLH